jgi:hypothetical protein
VPKDPAISGSAENGVFAYVQPCAVEAAVCRRPWTIRGLAAGDKRPGWPAFSHAMA